jgi:hypothetical protein
VGSSKFSAPRKTGCCKLPGKIALSFAAVKRKEKSRDSQLSKGPNIRIGLELGAWSLELGAWSLELGAWS